MPESISYSPLHMPFLSHPLLRRDLYDTRFQLANTSGFPAVSTQPEAAGEEDEYVDALTDLIPGLYEGGLKTWEGGMDLVEVLAGVPKGAGEWVRGSQILEVSYPSLCKGLTCRNKT
jgi:protein-histidine N-methyltransferase